MEVKEITVYKKSNKKLIAKIFEDKKGVKMIVSDDCEVILETKDSQNCEPVSIQLDFELLEEELARRFR